MWLSLCVVECTHPVRDFQNRVTCRLLCGVPLCIHALYSYLQTAELPPEVLFMTYVQFV